MHPQTVQIFGFDPNIYFGGSSYKYTTKKPFNIQELSNKSSTQVQHSQMIKPLKCHKRDYQAIELFLCENCDNALRE